MGSDVDMLERQINREARQKAATSAIHEYASLLFTYERENSDLRTQLATAIAERDAAKRALRSFAKYAIPLVEVHRDNRLSCHCRTRSVWSSGDGIDPATCDHEDDAMKAGKVIDAARTALASNTEGNDA